MKNSTFIPFYIIAFPMTLLIGFTINLFIIFNKLDPKYVGLELILLSLCSISYLLRLMIKTKFHTLPMHVDEAHAFMLTKSKSSELFSLIIFISLIVWTLSLFLVQIL
ncbi:MAG: hypothetical protein K0S01_3764 [Herbinix sp.]|jgi:hypothetical protein|nr:hypothetical protein [Herbinix sp.]